MHKVIKSAEKTKKKLTVVVAILVVVLVGLVVLKIVFIPAMLRGELKCLQEESDSSYSERTEAPEQPDETLNSETAPRTVLEVEDEALLQLGYINTVAFRTEDGAIILQISDELLCELPDGRTSITYRYRLSGDDEWRWECEGESPFEVVGFGDDFLWVRLFQ
ncbi:hypothetical protein FWD07_02745 [Candidatus Saccharibacteria bacterium]|nr:hypothetical protein [Candidatus Saccharibacteria bacterium]